jgi:hypothetical protein
MNIVNLNDELSKTEVAAPVEKVLTSAQKRFYASDAAHAARKALQSLVNSAQYRTDSTYFTTGSKEFVDRHMYHLSVHPSTNIQGYISNLKLMTRIKQ